MPKLRSDIFLDDTGVSATYSRRRSEADPAWELRCDIIAHARMGRDDLIGFLEGNEGRIRSMGYRDSVQGQEIHRAVMALSPTVISMEDSDLLESLFGPLVPVVPVIHEKAETTRRPMGTGETIRYMRGCTFEYFDEWLHASEDFIQGLDESDLTFLYSAIEHVCDVSPGLPRQRRSHPGSEEEMKAFVAEIRGDNRMSGCCRPSDACCGPSS